MSLELFNQIAPPIAVPITSIFLIWHFYFRKLIICEILQKQGSGWLMVHKQKISPKKSEFSWDKRTYILELGLGVIERVNRVKLYYNKEGNKPLEFQKFISKPSGLTEIVMKNEAYGRVYRGERDKFFTVLIVVLIAGLVIVSGLALYLQNQSNLKIAELIANQTKGVI